MLPLLMVCDPECGSYEHCEKHYLTQPHLQLGFMSILQIHVKKECSVLNKHTHLAFIINFGYTITSFTMIWIDAW